MTEKGWERDKREAHTLEDLLLLGGVEMAMEAGRGHSERAPAERETSSLNTSNPVSL